ncbi:MAG: transporter substrate-binding domain-containing protein [Psychrobium sp.]|nr:transporter substrate-binding domain-containing protein [Psychrobium sp.]
MAKISIDEITAIENTWIFNEALRSSVLSSVEKTWLKNNPHLEIATAFNWYPFIFIDPNGKPTSYDIDLVALINTNIGTQFKVKRYPFWQDDLFDQRIAVIKEYVITDILKAQRPNAKFIYVKNSELAFQAIADGEADVGVFSASHHKYLVKYQLKTTGSFYSKAGEYAMGTSKKQPILRAIISKGINSITVQLLTKWDEQAKSDSSLFTTAELQYIATNPLLRVGIDKWQPIIFSDGKEVFGIFGDFFHQHEDITISE